MVSGVTGTSGPRIRALNPCSRLLAGGLKMTLKDLLPENELFVVTAAVAAGSGTFSVHKPSPHSKSPCKRPTVGAGSVAHAVIVGELVEVVEELVVVIFLSVFTAQPADVAETIQRNAALRRILYPKAEKFILTDECG